MGGPYERCRYIENGRSVSESTALREYISNLVTKWNSENQRG